MGIKIQTCVCACVCVVVMEDGLDSGLFCQESGVGGGGRGRAGSLPSPGLKSALGLVVRRVCVWLGLHCHTVHTVYAYHATVRASLSPKCLLGFILGEFHAARDGGSL